MPWSPLASRFADLPLVIAGPILRRVSRISITVWVALGSKAEVTLTIYDHDKPPRTRLGEAKRTTVAVGQHLHIVAVTAPVFPLLAENAVYFYDLNFRILNPQSTATLIQAITRQDKLEVIDRIAYPPYRLPSFAFPPADLNKLRLIQGSCRKPNGGTKNRPETPETKDAFGLLDMLIADTAERPLERPHQLLLTGDQIYADEVADVLLAAVTDAADFLFGWKELLPASTSPVNTPMADIVGGLYPVPMAAFEAAALPPTTRTNAIYNAGFTTGDTRSHLISLGEYLAMYLFAWSDELWTDLPTLAEMKALFPAVAIDGDLATDLVTQRNAVVEYRKTLVPVRRALANIPSYMICDDHEVTDDWNMTRRFCENVYSSDLGMRIMQNGLIAFSICQAWGNTPEQFWENTQAAGTRLLNTIEGISAAEAGGTHVYHTFDSELRQRVGIHDAATLAAQPKPYAVYHDLEPFVKVQGVQVSSASVQFHFTVEGPSHQIIVTDSRSWRSFPTPGMETHPDLIGPRSLTAQLETDPLALGDRLLMMVATTNLPPIVGIREVAFIGGAGNYYIGKRAGQSYLKTKAFLYDNDLNDSWEFPSLGFDQLIVALSRKLPKVGDTATGQVILMSGDVHFSFASRLAYWAEIRRLTDLPGQEQKVSAVFAQLVASAFKNELGKTRGLQRDGYKYTPADWQQHVSWPLGPAGYVGWNIASASRVVGHQKAGWVAQGHTLTATGEQPTIVAPLLAINDVTLDAKPDYRYRLDYLATSQTGQTVPGPPSLGPTSASDRTAAARSHARANRAHRDLINAGAKLPDVIGFNNLSEVTFVWQRADGKPAASVNDPLATNKHVLHKLRWQEAGTTKVYWAQYDVSLNIDDTKYGKLRASGGVDHEP